MPTNASISCSSLFSSALRQSNMQRVNIKMKSHHTGARSSETKVLNISPHGFWMLIDGKEHFLAFSDFPWFQSASVTQICGVERVSADHFYWPGIDVDLHLESIQEPERFPLNARLNHAT